MPDGPPRLRRLLLTPRRIEIWTTPGRRGAAAARVLYRARRPRARIATARGHGRAAVPGVARVAGDTRRDHRVRHRGEHRHSPGRGRARCTRAKPSAGSSRSPTPDGDGIVVKLGLVDDDGLAREAARMTELASANAATPSTILIPTVRWHGRHKGWFAIVTDIAVRRSAAAEPDLEDARAAACALARTPRGFVVHGDLAPWNIVPTESGLVLVDWEDSRFEEDPLYDLAHYVTRAGALLRAWRPESAVQQLTGEQSIGWRYLDEIGLDPTLGARAPRALPAPRGAPRRPRFATTRRRWSPRSSRTACPAAENMAHGPLRVLQVHNRYRQLGGEDAVVASEADILLRARSRGHRALRQQPRWRRRPPPRASRPAPWNPASARAIRSAVREIAARRRPRAQHWFTLSPSVLGALRRAGVPVVMTLHNYRLVCVNAPALPRRAAVPRLRRAVTVARGPAPLLPRLRRLVGGRRDDALVQPGARIPGSNAVDRFIAPSHGLRDTIVAGGLPADRVVVRPHAVADVGTRESQPPSSFARCCTRGASRTRRASTCCSTRGRVARPAGIELVVVGDGPLRGPSSKAARSTACGSRVGSRPTRCAT